MSKAREDTRKLLRAGGLLFAAGVVGALCVLFGGGMGHHGPRSGWGWFGLMLACATLPLSFMSLLLGFGKLREDHRR